MSLFKDDNPGCPNGGCGSCGCGQICVTVGGCSGTLSGVLVTVTLGGTTIGTATTVSGGTACIPIASAGTYVVTFSKTGYTTVSKTVTATCTTNSISVGMVTTGTQVCFAVTGCGGNLAGALVTLTLSGTTIGTCTTDGTGACCIAVSGYGSYSYTITATNWTNGTGTATVSACGTTNVSFDMVPAAGYSCSADTCCPQGGTAPFPDLTWPTTIFVNDGFGLVTCTGTIGTGWTGCATRTATGVTDTRCPVPTPPAPTVGAITVGVNFFITCAGGWSATLRIKSNCPAGFTGTAIVGGVPTGGTWPQPGDCSSSLTGDTTMITTVSLTATVCPPSLAVSGSQVSGGTIIFIYTSPLTITVSQ